MIKIDRLACPTELTQEVKDAKTEKFKNDGSYVWKEDYIKTRLLEMSHNKCCYCECNVTEGGSYMEIEHFHPKCQYPDEVVEWNNLLPSCKKCNTQKGEHDTVSSPIINPSTDMPQDHLKIRMGFRFKSKDDMGEETIEALDLNNQNRHTNPRHKVLNKVEDKVASLLEQAKTYISIEPKTTLRKNKLLRGVRELLELCQPTEPYSAFKATALLTSDCYTVLKDILNSENLWSQEFIDLERNLLSIKYETC